jgi:DNA replication protein DnaC
MPGTGKSHLATGLAIAACRQRRRVRFTTAAALVNQLGYGNDSVQNGPFGYQCGQLVSKRRRTEVLPMPSRLAISDFESFSFR